MTRLDPRKAVLLSVKPCVISEIYCATFVFGCGTSYSRLQIFTHLFVPNYLQVQFGLSAVAVGGPHG